MLPCAAVKGAVLLASVAAVVLAPANAWADPIDVEDLIRQGVELRRDGLDERALPLFQRAYSLAPTPRTAAQLGLVEMALGYRLEAEQHLRQALAAPRDLWVLKRRRELEDALVSVRAAIGYLTVTGEPAGAEVRVNGNLIGRLPLPDPVRLGEGPASVELRAPGYQAASRAISVTGGGRLSVQIALQPGAVETPPREGSAVTRPVGVTPEDAGADDDARDRRRGVRLAAWVVGAGAVLAAGLTLFEALSWRARTAAFDQHRGPLPGRTSGDQLNCAAAEPARGGPGCQALYDDLSAARTRGLAALGVTGALAAVSTVLFLGSGPAPVSRSGLTLAVGPSWFPALAYRGAF